jgi:tripartite-type tricarboxylate transporter receptor subunit TctC
VGNRFVTFAMLALAGLLSPAQAQEFPTRPITILVGLAPGGVTDAMARVYADAVAKLIGQRVIIENRAAASGSIAASALQTAQPDGYTLLIFSGAQHATVPAIGDATTYDPVKGAQPITLLFNIATILAVPGNSPINSMAQLTAFAKNKPGGLTVGSPGIGTPSHLTAAKLMLATKTPAHYVHYRGGGPMMQDLVPGRLDAAMLSTSLARPFLLDKRIRGIALDAPGRWSVVAEVPNLEELGLREATVASWFGVAAPPGTPQIIVAKLHQVFIGAARDPSVRQRVEAAGLTVATSTPQEMGELMAKEAVEVEQLVRTLGLNKQ